MCVSDWAGPAADTGPETAAGRDMDAGSDVGRDNLCLTLRIRRTLRSRNSRCLWANRRSRRDTGLNDMGTPGGDTCQQQWELVTYSDCVQIHHVPARWCEIRASSQSLISIVYWTVEGIVVLIDPKGDNCSRNLLTPAVNHLS